MNSDNKIFYHLRLLYNDNKRNFNYIAKLIIFFLVFLAVLKSDYTYSPFVFLSDTLVISIIAIILSFISCFFDIRIFMLLFSFCVPISLVQNLGLALLSLFILLTIFILFGSISSDSALIIMMTICMSYIKIPYVVPVYLGMNRRKGNMFPALIGFFIFFFVQSSTNALLFNQELIRKDVVTQIVYGFTYILQNMITNSEFLVSCLTCIIVIILNNYIKNIYLKYGRHISIILSYAIFFASFTFNNLLMQTRYNMINLVIFMFISMIISYIICVIDDGVYHYKKTQKIMFKDDNNVYYVEIVPRTK